MKTYKLITEKITEEYPVRHIGKFDPFLEYFMFDSHNAYIIRNIENNIYVINLFSFGLHKITEEEFENLPKSNVVFVLPHFTGGCCDYTEKIRQIEYKERAKMFQQVANMAKKKAGNNDR